jgi:hypothetical protein
MYIVGSLILSQLPEKEEDSYRRSEHNGVPHTTMRKNAIAELYEKCAVILLAALT